MANGHFHYIKGVRQPGYTLIDERNGITLTLKGFDELEKKLDLFNKKDISKKMLQAAEPILMGALDTEMLRHPGPLQKSLQSTGARQNAAGNWYLAYRATSGNEKKTDNRKNPEKMVYLVNREWIEKRNGKPLKKGYAIPADDVIGETIKKSEKAVYDAMQDAFNQALTEIWGD